ncbi:hypothetical protein CTRI78_v006648 [Colletotrichum trifolii]|uniref:Uncharacterized protein n=1 Tax=Colletotrichum trifolii TaxID=5466 RepID=A0A4R8RF56_COLTR|nr:hypothetical protein CTRI78_v006648 [Colletotrichum trifolii]
MRALAPSADWNDGIHFDIGEDEVGQNPGFARLPDELAHLLYESLPADLSTTRKEALIVMATWEGKMDRYAQPSRASAFPSKHGPATVADIQNKTSIAVLVREEGNHVQAAPRRHRPDHLVDVRRVKVLANEEDIGNVKPGLEPNNVRPAL